MANANKILITGLILILLLVTVIVKRSKNIVIINPTESKLQLQENQEGNVTIKVIPETVVFGKKPSFKLEFNTHSVDLNFDVTKSTYLADDRGIIYKNSLWEGMPPEGHHRSGILTFQTPLSKTKYIDLVFININGVSERKFHWEL